MTTKPIFLFLASILVLSGRGEAEDVVGVLEWIEIPHEKFQQLVAVEDAPLDGAELRGQIAKHGGKVVEALAFRTGLGQRALIRSADEETYASEFNPPQVNEFGGKLRAVPAALETRYVGFMAEVEAQPDESGATIILDADWTRLLGMKKLGQDLCEIAMPEFYQIRHSGHLVVGFGKSVRLISTFIPPDSDFRVLLFLRTELPAKDDAPAATDQISVLFESIEIDLTRLNEILTKQKLTTRGPELRAALLEDLAKGNASLVDTAVISGSSQTRITSESHVEKIYPSEYDPPEMSDDGELLYPNMPGAFEVRNIGQRRQGEFHLVDDSISFSLVSEQARQSGEVDFQKGESSAPFPLFYTERLVQSTTLKPGEVALLGTTRPDKALNPDRKLPIRVHFLRVEAQK